MTDNEDIRSEAEEAEWAAHRAKRAGLYRGLGLSEDDESWWDADTLMLHSMMFCLGLYIEEAGGVEQLEKFTEELRPEIPADPPGGSIVFQVFCQSEALAIWKWWTIDRPAHEAKHEEEMEYLYGQRNAGRFKNNPESEEIKALKDRHAAFLAAEAKDHENETQMLERLLKIRGRLWT